VPAKTLAQRGELKELFRQRIRDKVAREKETVKQRIDREVPSWLAWALKPVAGMVFDSTRRRDSEVGQSGENRAWLTLWLWLPKQWVVINDLVLEPEREEFVQIDHVVIGTSGVYLIETKNWDGAFKAYKDNWQRKQGSGWVRCESPTRQNQRHLRLFEKWVESTLPGLFPSQAEEWLFPVVVFMKASWLRTKDCSMPVVRGGLELVGYIRSRAKKSVLNAEQIEALCHALVNARPWPETAVGEVAATEAPKQQAPAPAAPRRPSRFHRQPSTSPTPAALDVHRGRTRQGREFVRVIGSRERAEQVRAQSQAAGERPGPLRPDRFTEKAWFFELEVLHRSSRREKSNGGTGNPSGDIAGK